MRFDPRFRDEMSKKIKGVVTDIRDWDVSGISAAGDEIAALAGRAVCFAHCAEPDRPFLVAAADSSGDFPCAQYGDTVVYFVTALSRLYEAVGLPMSELPVSAGDIADFLWLPEDKAKARAQFLNAFSALMGVSLEEVCRDSDYCAYAKQSGKRVSSPAGLLDTLLLPNAYDAANVGIQLYSAAEAGALVRLMKSIDRARFPGWPVYILADTTLALPMVTAKSTLFFEIAKRYVCEYAHRHGFLYMTLSKSHNLPYMDLIEGEILKKNLGGEHWFFRVPCRSLGEAKPTFLSARTIPPVGAVSYIFKLHHTTRPLRLDMSLQCWRQFIQCEDGAEQLRREVQIFRDLDFASHDQRCYGYPYPLKACHDLAGLTEDERTALRKRFVDEAVRAGLKRSGFIDPGAQAGHR